MLATGILLLIAGFIELICGTMAYGDIGLSFIFLAISSVIGGIGLILGGLSVSKLKKNK